MRKIYYHLFSAYTSISEAIHLHLFPVRENLNGLSQMQPLLVPGTIKRF
ncbi:MAG: hypothetical protein H7Y86_17710 [Rhizobacter sp.]|nr:hypothetical protein [Ferruginibacter sp.]